MKAGALRHSGVLQRRVSFGDVNTAPDIWVDVRRMHFSLKPLTAAEGVEASGLTTLVTHEMRCRFTPDVTNEMRILHDGRVFYLQEVVNVDERDRELLLKVVERGSA